MSTKEIAYSILDQLTEEELEAFIFLFGRKSEKKEKKTVQGAWHTYANPDLIPLEDGAWERAVVERYGIKNEDT